MGAQDLIQPLMHSLTHATDTRGHDRCHNQKCLGPNLHLQSQLPGGQAGKDVSDGSSMSYWFYGGEYRVMGSM